MGQTSMSGMTFWILWNRLRSRLMVKGDGSDAIYNRLQQLALELL